MGTLREEIERRNAAIIAEIAELGSGHPWAGTYRICLPAAFQRSLLLAPRSGFIEYTRYNSGESHIPIFGEVVKVDGCLHFTSFLKKTWATPLVHWGERQYLIPEDEFLFFCQHVNADYESRSPYSIPGRFLLREGDERKKATRLPTLPEPFLHCILERPILATVTDVIEKSRPLASSRFREFYVTIDCGSADGVFMKGNFFELKALEEISGEVVEVREQASVLRVITAEGECVEMGTLFSTQPVQRKTDWW